MSSLEHIKQHTDILSIASHYCELQKTGNHYKA